MKTVLNVQNYNFNVNALIQRVSMWAGHRVPKSIPFQKKEREHISPFLSTIKHMNTYFLCRGGLTSIRLIAKITWVSHGGACDLIHAKIQQLAHGSMSDFLHMIFMHVLHYQTSL